MNVVPRPLFNAQLIPNSDTTVYTAPSGINTIVDKLTVYNGDSGTQTLAINIIPSGGSVGASNLVAVISMTTGQTVDFSQVQNQILATGDKISLNASVASKIVARGSGREVTL